MTISITFPTINLSIKAGKSPYQTVFTAILPTKGDNTTARFILDDAIIGLVKVPLRKVATPNGEAFLYCLIATIYNEGTHTLRVENLDTSNPTPIIKEFAAVPFTFIVDSKLTVVRGSEIIAAHLKEVDPHSQYLTQEEANVLYRTVDTLTDSDIPSTQATDAEIALLITNLKFEVASGYRPLGEISDTDIASTIARDTEIISAISALKSEADPLPQYLQPNEADARYRQSSVPLSDSDIPSTQATDAEVNSAVAKLKTESDARYRSVGEILESDIASTIARDTEVDASISDRISNLKSETDPLPQYLQPDEADVRYRQSSVPLSDADIPSTQATDAEVNSAVAKLKTESDARYRQSSVPLTGADIPSTQATDAEIDSAVSRLRSESDLKYRQVGQIPDADIASSIARDTEVTDAISGLKTEIDPLPQYLLPNEGDSRYRQIATALTDADIPTSIARDAETTAAITAHTTAADPHTQYLNQSRGDGRYRQIATPLTDADIPTSIARDAETTAAITAHTTATDPHTQYLNQSRGDGRYRQIATPLTDADIPASIARDAETTAAITAHTTAADPHMQYLTAGRGDERYFNINGLFRRALPTALVAGNSFGASWNSVEPGLGIAELCNYAGNGGGDAFNFFRMPGAENQAPSISHRIARISSSGAYVQTSDRRVKSNFSEAPGLNVLLSLSPQKYQHWECLGIDKNNVLRLGENFVEKIGFVAQDLQQFLPEAVSATTSEGELYGIDTSVVVAVAVKAIQELEAQVRELRSQLETAIANK
jgi:hypothetical protein